MIGLDLSVFSTSGRAPVGLDIGGASVQAVAIRRTLNGARVISFAQRVIPPELRESDDGLAFLKESLDSMWTEAGFESSRVVCSLPKSLVKLNFLTLPGMSARDLRGAVEMELRKMVPFDLEASVYDYIVVGPTGHDGKIGVLTAAVSREDLAGIVDAVEEAGLQIVGMSVSPCALESIVSASGSCPADQTVGVIDLGYSGTTVSVLKGGKLQFARDVGASGKEIIKALSRKIVVQDEAVELGPQDVEGILRNRNVLNPRNPSSQVSATVRPIMEKLVSQTKRSFVYYRQVFKDAAIDRVALTGGLSKLQGLKDHLAKELGMEVELLRPVGRASSDSAVVANRGLESASPDMAAAAGMALSTAKKIDLLTGELRGRNVIERVRPYFNLAAVGSFCVFLLLSSAIFFRIRNYERRDIPALRKHAEPLQPILERLEEYRKLRDETASRHEGLLALEERLPSWEGILRELSHVVPSDVVLTRVAPVKAARISMEGMVYSERRNKTLSEFMALIRKSPFFGEVLTWEVNPPLAADEGAAEGASVPASFRIECTLLY